MGKKLFAVRLQQIAALFSSIFLSGCVTLAKSQENFAKEMHGNNAPAAASMAHISIVMYILLVLGLVVSSFGGYFIVSPYLNLVKKYLNNKEKSSSLSVVAGCIERAAYTAAFLVNWYAAIAVIIALKIGQLIIICLGLETKKTGRVAISFMFGSLISLGIAILVGVIMKKLLVLV